MYWNGIWNWEIDGYYAIVLVGLKNGWKERKKERGNGIFGWEWKRWLHILWENSCKIQKEIEIVVDLNGYIVYTNITG